MSNSKYTITLVCIPQKYLPFPSTFIPENYYISTFCGHDHFTVFFISEKNSSQPARIFYSVESVIKEYYKLTTEVFEKSELIRARLALNEDWLKSPLDKSFLKLNYLSDYFSGHDGALEDIELKIIDQIIFIKASSLKDLDEDLNLEIEKIKITSEKEILEKNIGKKINIVKSNLTKK